MAHKQIVAPCSLMHFFGIKVVVCSLGVYPCKIATPVTPPHSTKTIPTAAVEVDTVVVSVTNEST